MSERQSLPKYSPPEVRAPRGVNKTCCSDSAEAPPAPQRARGPSPRREPCCVGTGSGQVSGSFCSNTKPFHLVGPTALNRGQGPEGGDGEKRALLGPGRLVRGSNSCPFSPFSRSPGPNPARLHGRIFQAPSASSSAPVLLILFRMRFRSKEEGKDVAAHKRRERERILHGHWFDRTQTLDGTGAHLKLKGELLVTWVVLGSPPPAPRKSLCC